MPLQINYYSKSLDKDQFIYDFIHFAHNDKLPFELLKKYFSLYPLDHDFILIKNQGKIILKSMFCLTLFKDISYFGLLDFDIKYSQENNHEGLLLFKNELKNWSFTRNASKILGPINFSTWLPYRLMSELSNAGPHLSFEPDGPLEYCQYLKSIGFTTNQLFSSRAYKNLSEIILKTEKDFKGLDKSHFDLEFFPNSLSIDDLKDLHRLSLHIFEDNYLATPIDFETFSKLYMASYGHEKQNTAQSLSLFIKTNSGERIGFFIAFIEKEYVIAKTIGVLKEYRGKGLSNAAMNLSFKQAKALGLSNTVMAMVKEGAQSESYGKKSQDEIWAHYYEVLELL